MRGHPVGDAQGAREEWPVGVLDQEEPAGDQGPVGSEPDPLVAAGYARTGAGQLEGQARARASA